MRKRILAALLCLCMVAVFFPTTAFATDVNSTKDKVWFYIGSTSSSGEVANNDMGKFSVEDGLNGTLPNGIAWRDIGDNGIEFYGTAEPGTTLGFHTVTPYIGGTTGSPIDIIIERGRQYIYADGQELQKSTITIPLGKTHQLNTYSTDENGNKIDIATDYPSLTVADHQPTYSYTSQNPSIATVDANGLVTPISRGIATIQFYSPVTDSYFAATGIFYIAVGYSVTNTLTHITSNGKDAASPEATDYTASLTADAGYTLPATITVKMGGTELTAGTDYTYSGGSLTIPAAKINGDIEITAEGVANTYTYNTPDPVTRYGVTATTSITPTGPHPAGTRLDFGISIPDPSGGLSGAYSGVIKSEKAGLRETFSMFASSPSITPPIASICFSTAFFILPAQDIDGFTVEFDLVPSSHLSVSPASLDFGIVSPGYSQPAAQALTVRDLDNHPITFSGAPHFTVTSGGSVTPKPDLPVGAYHETLTVSDEYGVEANVELNFVVAPNYSIAVDPTSLDFGSVYTGYAQPAAQTVTITNTGAQSIDLTPPTSTNYEIGTPSKTTLATYGETATFTVTPITGLGVGTYNDTITVSGSNGTSASVDVTFAVAHAHAWATTVWATDTTHHWHECTAAGCTITDDSLKDGYGAHTAGDWIIDTNATSSTNGSKHKECTACGYVMETATEHTTHGSGTKIDGQAATHTAAGWRDYYKCSGCDKLFEEAACTTEITDLAAWKAEGGNGYLAPIAATEYTISFDVNGGSAISSISRDSGTTVDLTGYEPTKDGFDFDGWCSDSSLTTKVTSVELISDITVYAKWTAKTPDMPFVDVPEDASYRDAVLWAVEKGITMGTSATTFSPNGICTRAQAVTFLWRANGSPAPKSTAMPFHDVPAGSYYYKAVQWAVEQGIIKGTSSTTFSPDRNCSRAQIVTILWRSEDAKAATASNPFADVSSNAYYADAVLWAVEKKVTEGTSATTFSPDADCTRAQIVTFIRRDMK